MLYLFRYNDEVICHPNRSIPRITIYIGYDRRFLKYVAGNNKRKAERIALETVDLVRPMYSHNSGLGRKFNLKVINAPKYFNEDMRQEKDDKNRAL